MKRVFIQSGVSYPRDGAQSNYIENLSKAIRQNGYEIIFITGINREYLCDTDSPTYKDNEIKPIIPSSDENKAQYQRKHGFFKERMQALKDYEITATDVVITFEIGYNVYYHQALLELKKDIGFKVIAAVVELYGKEDFEIHEKYENFRYVIDNLYPQYDAILSISENIDNYYQNKRIKTYRLPPMVDAAKRSIEPKDMNKNRFIVTSPKDSFDFILEAFSGLGKEELQEVELHTCNVSSEYVKKCLSTDKWNIIRDIVTIHDWLKYEELLKLYNQMHFVIIARNECQRTLANFPSKVPESMNLGIVPIVSDVGDYTKYYLRNGIDSIFIKGDSVEEIRKSIRIAIKLTNMEFEKYSKNAMLRAETRFDYHVWVQKVEEMLTLN